VQGREREKRSTTKKKKKEEEEKRDLSTADKVMMELGCGLRTGHGHKPLTTEKVQ